MLLSGLSQGGVIAIIAVVIVIILGILIVATNLKLVRQTQKFVVERVGKYQVSFTFFYETNILEDSKTRYSLHYSYY